MRITLLLLVLLAPQDEWKVEARDVQIPMRDGKSLAADLFLPPKAGKYPVVLIQTPYNKKGLGKPIGSKDATSNETGRGSISDALGLLDRDNYVYCVVDWRGFFASKGAMEGVDPKQWKRGQDGYDCVEWLASQAWSNGKIGMWGGSALGKQQLDTCAEHPPHLVCAVPLIASMGSTYDGYYEGGVLLESHVDKLDQLGFGVGKRVKESPLPSAPIWKYAERMTYRPETIEVPCLLITGWWDNFPDLIIKTFDDLGAKARPGSKLLIGPWDHVSIGIVEQGDWKFEKAAKMSADAAKAFFDFWLRDQKNGWDKTARVRYWTVNEEAWSDAEEWAKIKRSTRTLHLNPDGAIAVEAKKGTRVLAGDPRKPTPTLGGANLPPVKHGPTSQAELDGRKDVLVYAMKLTSPLRVNGNVEISLPFASNRADFTICARLCDVGSDGKPILIADAAKRARLETGKTMTLRFSVTATTWPAGHELRIYLSTSNWPRYGRNPNTGADHWDEKTAVDVEITIEHEKAELRVPVVE